VKLVSPTKVSRRGTFRDALRMALGPDGERAWRVILDIAEGRPWTPTLENGATAEPVVPSTRDRLEAATYLANALFGKPVEQTQVAAAEKAAQDNAELVRLSDDELFARARAIVEGTVVSVNGVPEKKDEEPQ
jgi:hypothetical protein